MTGMRFGTKTREVLEAFKAGESLDCREISNRVGFVSVRNDASAVSSYVVSLVTRGYLNQVESEGLNRYELSLKGRVENEMVVERDE